MNDKLEKSKALLDREGVDSIHRAMMNEHERNRQSAMHDVQREVEKVLNAKDARNRGVGDDSPKAIGRMLDEAKRALSIAIEHNTLAEEHAKILGLGDSDIPF